MIQLFVFFIIIVMEDVEGEEVEKRIFQNYNEVEETILEEVDQPEIGKQSSYRLSKQTFLDHSTLISI